MTRKYYWIIIFVASYFQQISTNIYLPGLSLQKCSLEDSECLITQVQKSVYGFTSGIPDLGIEKLDPMVLDSVVIRMDGLIYEIRNITINGLKNAVIDNVWIDTSLKYIHLTFHTTLNLECDYMADGFLFTLPVNGAGKAHIVKKNVITEMLLLFEFKNEDGQKFINLNDYRYGTNVNDGSVYQFENLYNGDKAKSDTTHEFINRNWRTTSQSFAKLLFDQINDKIFNAIKSYLKLAVPTDALPELWVEKPDPSAKYRVEL